MSEDAVMPPLAVPLHLAAAELADLVRLADDLQAMVARIAARHGAADPQLVLEGQSADLLSQRLAGVSYFLSALADTVPDGVPVDVLAAVKGLGLSAQARRLSASDPSLRVVVGAGDDAVFFGD